MNKTLLKSVREYKKQSILAPILVILEVLMEVLIPMEMANIIDIGMTSGDLHYIIQRGVILVVMAMLSLFFGISRNFCFRRAYKGVIPATHLRQEPAPRHLL